MKEKQKRKLIFVLAFLLVFISILLFGYYHFLPTKELAVKHTDSLNTKLPPIQQPLRPLTKMEMYLQAEKDSVAKQEQRSRDPYAANKKDPPVQKPSHTNVEHRIKKLYADLDKAVSKNTNSKPVKENQPSAEKLFENSDRITDPVITHSNPTVLQTDPELQQLSSMLDKLTALQNPVKTPRTKKIDSSLLIKAVDDKTIQAVVHQDQVVSNGGILKLRLLQDINLGGTAIARGTFVYGVCQVNNERLMVQLTSIATHNQVLPFPLTVYDMDGIEGIYMPGAITRETGKEGADNALQSIQLGTLDATVAAQAANAGLQTAKNLLSRKFRALRVTAKAGHRVFLQKTSSSPQ